MRLRLVHLGSLVVRGRFWLLILAHAAVFTACLLLAYAIRLETVFFPIVYKQQVVAVLPWIIGAKLVCFYAFRSFHGWWRHITFSDLKSLFQATSVSLLVIVLIDYFLLSDQHIPRSVIIIDALICFIALGSIRSSWRMLNEEVKPRLSKHPKKNVILVGASEATWRLAHQLRSLPDLRYNIIGMVSTPGCDMHRWMASLPVLGDLDSLGLVLSCYSIQEILVPAGELAGSDMRKLNAFAKNNDKQLRVIPRIEDVLSSSGKMPLRNVDIDDLLQRELRCWMTIKRYSSRQVVLVTGAGGSIGSEICRQVLKFSRQAHPSGAR